jgi:hypothetical protein
VSPKPTLPVEAKPVEPKFPAADPDPNRQVAEWALSLGGWVRVADRNHKIDRAADLPKGRFLLTTVSLKGKSVAGAGTKQLKGLKGLTCLHLPGTALSDAGMADLGNLADLEELDLSDPDRLPGTTTARLKGFKQLSRLYLNGTKLTDAGLADLKDLGGLAHLHVRGTRVTPAGLDDFHAAVPGCRVEHDGGVIDSGVQRRLNPDRKVARWALSLGGSVQVSSKRQELKTSNELPKEQFTLVAVDVGGPGVTDAGLAQLKELGRLFALTLRDTKVTDAGLAHLKGLRGLRELGLLDSGVTDAGLEYVGACQELSYLLREAMVGVPHE